MADPEVDLVDVAVPADVQHSLVHPLRYDDGFWATRLDDGTNWSSDFSITYRFQGTEACLKGEIGFPHGRPSVLSLQRRGEQHWQPSRAG